LVRFEDERLARKPEEDFNFDDIPNIVHYALGTDPTASYSNGSPVKATRNSDGCTIVYERSKLASGITLMLEVSDDHMRTWKDATTLGITESVESLTDSDYELVTWTLPKNIPDNPRDRVTQTGPCDLLVWRLLLCG